MTFEMYNDFLYICIIGNGSKKREREGQKETKFDMFPFKDSHSYFFFSSQLLATDCDISNNELELRERW